VMKREECGRCKFWRANGTDDGRGECHKDTPSASPADNTAYWPKVVFLRWCGQFERRTKRKRRPGEDDDSP
jgi:hypothetical protein